MRIALGLEYAGGAFNGWQSQADHSGVQDALEAALLAIAGVSLRTHAAGRTDRGVHATMQVVHFDAEVERPLSAWVRGVNANLPDTVAVLWAAPVPETFHARFAATARHYAYVLASRPSRPGLLAGRVGWYHRELDLGAMQQALEALLGTHDFTAFRAAECQAKSPVKTLLRAQVRREGEIVRFDFSADAFLHHMIRNIVGCTIAIGAGKAPPARLGEILEGRDRTRAAATFAPDGLYFSGVDYPPQFALPCTRRELVIDVRTP